MKSLIFFLAVISLTSSSISLSDWNGQRWKNSRDSIRALEDEKRNTVIAIDEEMIDDIEKTIDNLEKMEDSIIKDLENKLGEETNDDEDYDYVATRLRYDNDRNAVDSGKYGYGHDGSGHRTVFVMWQNNSI